MDFIRTLIAVFHYLTIPRLSLMMYRKNSIKLSCGSSGSSGSGTIHLGMLAVMTKNCENLTKT